MCIAAPAHVVEINREENWLYADFGGARQQAKLDLLPDVEVGDYVLFLKKKMKKWKKQEWLI